MNMAFIGDGTKLASYHPIRIYDIVGLTSKQQNAVHGCQPVLQHMNNGWVVGQDDELLFWIPLEHREDVKTLNLTVEYTFNLKLISNT